MSSASKTLELLAYFSTARPEIGLSQFCVLAGRDKATTYRYLQTLEKTGFIEQNPETKKYRLGPILLQLAQTREATFPRKAGVEKPLSELANATGETSHVTVLSGSKVFGLASCDSPRYGTRVVIDVQNFPLHATASGLCALAFGPSSLMEVATGELRKFTRTTATTPQALEDLVLWARKTGFGFARGSFEDDTVGLSAPVFDHTGQFAGTVSVASVAFRFTADLEQSIKESLVIAAREITHNWGGTLPDEIEAVWSQTLSHTPNGVKA